MDCSGQGTPQNSRTMTSPTTSTPGLSPGGHLSTPASNGLRTSELQQSDESMVESTVEKSITIDMESTIDTTKEVTLYEKDEEDTTIQETSSYSCIAQRTRSRIANREIRKYNISQIQANLTLDMGLDTSED